MNFIFSFLKKNKTIFLVLLLFFIIGGIIMPQAAQAGWIGCAGGAAAGGAGGAAVGTFIFPAVGTSIGAAGGAVIGCITGAIWGADALEATAKGILIASGMLLLAISKWFLNLSSNLFISVTTADILQKSITANPTVTHGWAIVRDFANMFIVLGFVVVGIATILRIRTYEAQKTLLPLILVALLINFSLLICGIIIDATNITINYFTQISGPAGITEPIKEGIFNPETDRTLTALTGYDYVSAAFGLSVYSGVASMIFFIYAFLLLFRYVALMLLVILSPLAFVCYVFPATQSIFSKWWQQFTQWAIIGIPTAFFVYLAGHLINVPKDQTLQFWIPAAFLLFAYTLIFQTSAIGASAVTGLASGAVGFAAGKIKSGVKTGGMAALKGLGNKTGLTDKVKKMGGGALERIGLRSKGTTAQNAQKEMEERKKRVGAQTEDQQIASAKSRAFTPEQIRNKVASTENLVKDGKLHKIGNADEQAKAVADAEDHAKRQGYNTTIRADAEKQNHELAGLDKKNVDKELGVLGIADTPVNRARAQSSVNIKQLEKNWGNMDTEQRAKVDLSTFHTDDAKEFISGKHGSDLLAAARSLPATNTTRLNNKAVVESMIGTNINSNQPDLDVTANGYTGPTRHMDEALNEAIDRGDVNAQRKWRELRNKARTL